MFVPPAHYDYRIDDFAMQMTHHAKEIANLWTQKSAASSKQ
jgi:hypothetical protein